MQLHQLVYFEAASRLGSLVAAAAACHVSQPSLSVQIKALEEELGQRLLDRTPRGVIPTRAGERVALSARRVLGELLALRRDLLQGEFGRAPCLRVASVPFVATEVLPEVVADVYRQPGAWRVEVHERPGLSAVQAVLAGEADLAFCLSPGEWGSQLQVRRIADLELSAFCRKDHPVARRPDITDRELLACRILAYQDPVGIAEELARRALATGLELQLAFMSDQALSAFEMAAGGVGVAVLPTLFQRRAAQRDLAVIPLRPRFRGSTLHAAWRRGQELPVVAQRLIDQATRTAVASATS